MKTTTLRLEDHAMELLEGLAELTNRKPADIVRTGVLEYLTRLVNEDSPYREKAQQLDAAIRKNAIDAANAAVMRGLGRDAKADAASVTSDRSAK